METDPVEAAYLQVYQDNGLALIEMHRGNLERSLTLVTEGMARLDREIPSDRYLVHRSQLLHNRARVLVALQRFEEARADFDRLIEWDPDYIEYRMDRGNLARRLGDLAAALEDYDWAIKVSAPFAELFYNRADLRAEAGDVEGALADLTFVVEMEPTLADAWLNRGALLLEAGDPEAAGNDARAGLRQAPANPRLLCLLGLAEQSKGLLAVARAAFDDALAADPAHTPALVQRAVLAFEAGDCDASIADLERALALGGDDPDVLFNRGVAYAAAGRLEEAVEDFNRALPLRGADVAELLVARARAEESMARLDAGALGRTASRR
jgi:tetratricopeptide (TPR) repeat protein